MSTAPNRRPLAVSATAPPSSLLLDSQLCFALYSTSLAMTKLYRPYLVALGLTYPQYVVLLALWQRDGLTVSELGARVALDSGTLTPLLKRMQTAKLIQRLRGTEDERQVHISLTAKGSALRSKAAEVHERVACATACSSTERKTLTHSLQRLRASLLANAAN